MYEEETIKSALRATFYELRAIYHNDKTSDENKIAQAILDEQARRDEERALASEDDALDNLRFSIEKIALSTKLVENQRDFEKRALRFACEELRRFDDESATLDVARRLAIEARDALDEAISIVTLERDEMREDEARASQDLS